MDNRSILVITGEQTDCLRTAKALTRNLDTLLLEDSIKANKWLGQEFDTVIFNTRDGFSPNAFGAVTGTIRGGGYLLLLKPEKWSDDSLFLKRFSTLLASHDNIQFISASQEKLTPLLAPPKQEFTQIFATEEQHKAVDAIINVVKGHRRRPLVITSDRGRGKSASLGIAAAKLFEEGLKNIIVCAPSKKTAAVMFEHAVKNSPDCHLRFYSPDELQQQKPKADLLLIDEAAAIPVPLLTSFLKNYSRIVFATTQHGYEGSGRGFAINFRKVLDKVAPEWKSCHLKTPIRWQENDSLELFVFNALLLNAEPADEKKFAQFALSNCSFSTLDKAELIANPSQLEALFGLLVSAHYQTKPSDFMQMLDDKAISVFALRFEGYIVAVVLLAKEGDIDPQTAQHIFEGTRRLKGHLVAQSLAANVGIKAAPCLLGARVIRIAVHPSLQRQGIGTQLLESLSKKVDVDYLSSSFGASKPLLSFWQQCGYSPVYLSMKRDASSGTHSVIMLKAKGETGKGLLTKARLQFIRHFPHLLSDPFRHLEDDIALYLLAPQETNSLSTTEKDILHAFANKQRGYENSLYPLWEFVCQTLASDTLLTASERKILLIKVLQKCSWHDAVKKLGTEISGKREALQLLRQAIKKLIPST